jgi:hypothetical protein
MPNSFVIVSWNALQRSLQILKILLEGLISNGFSGFP